MENILQVPGNRAEVDQNHHARNGLTAILSVLNLSRAIFRRLKLEGERSECFAVFIKLETKVIGS